MSAPPSSALAPEPAPLKGGTLVLLTVGLSLGTFMQVLDSSIANVSLPAISGDLAVSPNQGTWVITSFAVSNAITLPLTGWLSRRFGDVRMFVLSTLLFTLASWLCGLANSLPLLIAARVLQGAVAGPMVPLSQSLLLNSYPPEKKGLALALWSMTVIVAPIIGPVLGGWITDNVSWPWIFYINLPVGAVALLMVSRFVYEPEDVRAANQIIAEKQRKNIDWIGITLLCVSLATLQYVLEEGARLDWFQSRLIVGFAILSLISTVAFVLHELTAPAPVVDLSLFKNQVFTSGTLIGAVMFAMLMAQTFLLPLFMQEMLGFTATQSGLALMPRSLAMMVTMPIVGRLYNRVSPRLFITFGIVLFAVTAYEMSHYTLNTGMRDVVFVLLLQGAAFACLFIPLTTAALSSIPRFKMADATTSNFGKTYESPNF